MYEKIEIKYAHKLSRVGCAMGVVLTTTDARMKVYFAFDGSGCLGPGINSMHLILMSRTLVEEYVCTILLNVYN